MKPLLLRSLQIQKSKRISLTSFSVHFTLSRSVTLTNPPEPSRTFQHQVQDPHTEDQNFPGSAPFSLSNLISMVRFLYTFHLPPDPILLWAAQGSPHHSNGICLVQPPCHCSFIKDHHHNGTRPQGFTFKRWL